MITALFARVARTCSPRRFCLLLGAGGTLFVSVSACGESSDDSPGVEAMGGSGTYRCQRDADCDDGVFCNGIEICSPAVAEADAHGCLTSSQPRCVSDDVCDEGLRACVADCDEEPDADGDGSVSTSCGGDDCDDSDGRRYPGNTEVCDDENIDEDCDPNTFGFRDQDMDGWPDAACCNVDEDGDEFCGTDCDDTVAVIHPTENELCDGLDNDCNGEVDDGVAYGELPIWYRDADGDGYGLQSAQRPECVNELEGYSRVGGDCDDLEEQISPEGDEICDGRDNDCDPGTHACWLHSRVLTAQKQPAVGVEGDIPFEYNCAPYGEGIAVWQFEAQNPNARGIFDIGIVCGNYVDGPGGYVVSAEGVTTPHEFTENNEQEITSDDCVALSGPRVTTIVGMDFVQEPYGPDGEAEHALERTRFTCGATQLFTEGLTMEVSEKVHSSGLEGTHNISCPDGTSPIGIHGTKTNYPGEGTYLTSIGMICAEIVGIETLE